MSAYSRNKGNAAEVEAAAATRRLGHDAMTSRDARGGSQGGHDLITDLPVCLEVKDGTGRPKKACGSCGHRPNRTDQLPGWLDQAREQAEDAPGAVLHKRRGKARAEEWFLTMRYDDFVGLVGELLSRPLTDGEVRW